MAVGLLTLTHGAIGHEIADAASSMLGSAPLRIRHIAVVNTDDPQLLQTQAELEIDSLDDGDGVLILTDLFGATPCNIANRLSGGHAVRIVSGISLPMMIRVFNYPEKKLDALAQCALTGGQRGVLVCSNH